MQQGSLIPVKGPFHPEVKTQRVRPPVPEKQKINLQKICIILH